MSIRAIDPMRYVGNAHSDIIALAKYLNAHMPATMWCGQGKGSKNIGANGKDINYEHSSGRALDIMIVEKVGMRPTSAELRNAYVVIEWLQKNAAKIGLNWLLFAHDGKATHSWNPTRGTWKYLHNAGSVSGNHIDHIHVFLRGNGIAPGSLSGLYGSNVESEECDMNPTILESVIRNVLNRDDGMVSLMTSRVGGVINEAQKTNEKLDRLICVINDLNNTIKGLQ